MRNKLLAFIFALLPLSAQAADAITPFKDTTGQTITMQIRTGVTTIVTASISEGTGSGATWYYIDNTTVLAALGATPGSYSYAVLSGGVVIREGVLNWSGAVALSPNAHNVNGAVAGNVTGNVVGDLQGDILGSMAGSVGSVGTGGITAATIATGAIDADAIATDAIGALELAADAIGASELSADSIGASEIAANSISSSELATAAVDEIVDTTWDELLSGHVVVGSTGAGLSAASSAGDPWSTVLPGAYGAGTAGKLIGDNVNATVSSRSSHTVAEVADGVWDEPTAGHVTSGTFGEQAKTDIDAILDDTGTSGVQLPAGEIVANTFGAGAIDATAIATDAVGADELAANAIGSSELATTAVDEIVDQSWDELLSGHVVVGSTGAALSASSSAGDPWATALPGAYGTGTAGKIIGDNINATISSRLAPTVAARTLDVTATGAAGIDWSNVEAPTTTVGLSGTTISTSQTFGSLDSVKTKTDFLPSATAGAAGGVVIAGSNAATTFATLTSTGVFSTNGVTDVAQTGNSYLVAAKLDTALVLDGAVYQFTANALELGTSASSIADAVWDELLSGHAISGSAGAGLSASSSAGDPWATALPGAYGVGTAGKIVGDIIADTNELQVDWVNGGRLDLILDSAASAGDPWATALPGAYGAGTAGAIIGTNVNATISSRASQTSVDTIDDFVDGAETSLTTISTNIATIMGDIGDLIVGTTSPRINRKPDPGFTVKISRRADGTYIAQPPIRINAGSVANVYVAVDMSPLFGADNFVNTVGSPTVSGGSITADDEGPRDTYAFVELGGTATAGEERTISVPVTMDTGTLINAVFTVKVFAQ